MSNPPPPPRQRRRDWLKGIGGFFAGVGLGLIVAWWMLNTFRLGFDNIFRSYIIPYENYGLYQLLSGLFGTIMLIAGLLTTAYALTRKDQNTALVA